MTNIFKCDMTSCQVLFTTYTDIKDIPGKQVFIDYNDDKIINLLITK